MRSVRQWWLKPLGLFLAVLLAACTPYPYMSEADRVLATQPASPLIPGQETPLAANDWRVVTATQAGEPLQLAALSPIRLSFGAERGILLVREENCNTSSYVIAADDQRHYRLYPLVSTAVGCGAIGDRQAAGFHQALVATTEFALQDNLLILSGPDVEIVAQLEQAPQALAAIWCFDIVTYPDGRHTIFAEEPGGGAGIMASTLPGVTWKQRCFPTWTAAAYYITGGTIILPPQATRQDYLEAVEAFLDRPIPTLP